MADAELFSIPEAGGSHDDDPPATQEDLPGTQDSEPTPATQEDPNAWPAATQEDPNAFHGAEEEEEEDVEDEEDEEDEEETNGPPNDENAGAAAAAGSAGGGSSSSGGSSSAGGSAGAASDPMNVVNLQQVLGKRKSKHDVASPTMARRAEVSWNGGQLAKMTRTISIDRLPQEGKRMNHSLLSRQPSESGIDRKTINLLLRPGTWTPSVEDTFALSADEVIALCDAAQEVLEAEPTLLQLSAPIKVFGDIHGQFADLMRLFDQFGSPSREAGDINVVDYLFLGDYVDRGKHSLEVMCLLLALKVQFPQRVFLVRGNHESPEVNARDGFLHECVQRLGGRPAGVAAWRRFNLLFEWLPMGALVNSVILGVHGGIGKYVESPQQIAELPRPLRMGGPHAQVLMDLLWSDPTSSDEVLGVHVNHERGAPVVCYGPDRVISFLQANRLKLILRAHECVMDGFQRFAGGRLITVFSATNYCNRWANAGAILLVGKDLEITPKMIYPLDDLEDAWIDAPNPNATSPTHNGGSAATADDLKDMRPPTPPRDCSDAPPRESPRRPGKAPPGAGMAPTMAPVGGGASGEGSCSGRAGGASTDEGDLGASQVWKSPPRPPPRQPSFDVASDRAAMPPPPPRQASYDRSAAAAAPAASASGGSKEQE